MTKKDEGRRQGKLFGAEGMDLVLANEHSQWKADVGAILDDLIQIGKPFDGDDIRARAKEKEIAEPHHQNCWGALMGQAAKKRRIKRVGMVPAATPSSHARMIGKWIRRDEETAIPEWML